MLLQAAERRVRPICRLPDFDDGLADVCYSLFPPVVGVSVSDHAFATPVQVKIVDSPIQSADPFVDCCRESHEIVNEPLDRGQLDAVSIVGGHGSFKGVKGVAPLMPSAPAVSPSA